MQTTSSEKAIKMSSLSGTDPGAGINIEKQETTDLESLSPGTDFQGNPELQQERTRDDDHRGGGSIGAHVTQSWVEHPKNRLHEFGFVAVLVSSQFMTQAGLAQTIAPLQIIGDSFGSTSPGQLSWFPAAYSLTVGTFILPAGRLGDLYGHKKLFVAGFFWWGLWSLIAGFSVYSGPILLYFCRAMQGIGSAFCLPNAIAIIGRSYRPGVRKQMMFSVFGATAPSGFVVGAAFSSLLAEFVWWPWAFWINAIVCVMLAVLGIFLIPATPPPFLDETETTWDRTDALGGLTGVCGLVLFNFAWNQAPVVGWQNPYTYVLLIVGLITLGIFGYIELKVTKFPLVPFRDMALDSGFVLACVALGWSGFSVWTYYFWQFLQKLRHLSPLHASAQFSPVIISGLIAAATTGFIIHRVPGSVLMGISLLAFTVGLILLTTAPVAQTYWAQTFVSLLIMPWGMDMSFPAANLLLSNKMPRDQQGVSASLVNTIINYSISVALGVAATIEEHVNDGGADLLAGYQGAWYLGIGVSAFGILVAVAYAFSERRAAKN
ncbi:major facilitator superfamily-domain-containing protein [Amylocarpus encephaloides]|uniref:Major facilitator superfamily-domain-containing protein n=1 Tax=Amylocarpus encephaloides TaxID=45428 RepID=A0A9P7YKM7_9HELO|nr:major facilitator superfamily-domain-containing protein [Amylocarpus encephaloides]